MCVCNYKKGNHYLRAYTLPTEAAVATTVDAEENDAGEEEAVEETAEEETEKEGDEGTKEEAATCRQ